MNEYLIEQQIKTLAKLDLNTECLDPLVEINGFSFRQWDFTLQYAWRGDAWVATKQVQSINIQEAVNAFRAALDPVIQKVAFVSQCYTDFHQVPFLVRRINDNKAGVFFYRHIREREPVGLHFGKDEFESYKALEQFKYQKTFRFLQEACNVIGYIPKLMLLFSALEAMCGKVDGSGRYVTYDKDEMKKIIGIDLYNEVFGTNGIRHKLDHGDFVQDVFGNDYFERIYQSILKFFNLECGTKINQEVKFPQRHFYGNYEFTNLWLRREDGLVINLKTCVENYNSTNNTVNGCEYAPDIHIDNY